VDRIKNIALGVAEGFAYLHSKQILYRDLKSHNIGFDEQGVVRIFDFGLAREVDAQGQLKHMTGAAGTPRYMAPECAKNESYGFSSDVYSFSILFWEILTLDKPFENVKTLAQFHKEVVRGNLRPSLKKVSAPDFKTLFEQGWDEEPTRRPDFATICQILRDHSSQSHLKLSRFLRKQVSYRTQESSVCRKEVTEPKNQAQVSSCPTEFISSSDFSNPNAHQDSVRWFPRVMTSFSLRRTVLESLESTAVDHSFAKNNRFQRFYTKRHNRFKCAFSRKSPLDVSTKSPVRRESFRSQNSGGSFRPLSGVSALSKNAMAEVLAVEAESNRKVLRGLETRN
jgi:serine/threonine protein kinase